MNGPEFVAATAAILFMAFLAGWFTHWLISRITRVTRSDMDDLDKMAQELHQAEEERDSTTAFYQQREAELSNKLSQTEAELEAAMDGLRASRAEAEELRGHVERMNQNL